MTDGSSATRALERQQFVQAHLEPGTLTSSGLFLDRHDLEHLILQRGPQEEVDDLSLLHSQTNKFYINMKKDTSNDAIIDPHISYLDGQRVQIDLLQGLDLHVLHQAPQLSDGNPLPESGMLAKASSIYNIVGRLAI